MPKAQASPDIVYSDAEDGDVVPSGSSSAYDNMYTGDDVSNLDTQSLVKFSLSGISGTLSSATLYLYVFESRFNGVADDSSPLTNPGRGDLRVYHIDDYGALDLGDYNAPSIGSDPGTLLSSTATPNIGYVSIDVKAAMQDDIDDGRSWSAFRISFPGGSDNDGQGDGWFFRTSEQTGTDQDPKIEYDLNPPVVSLDTKTDPGGTSWVSGTYLVGVGVDQTWGSGPHGDQSTTLTTFTSTAEVLEDVKLGAGDEVLLIATSQLWNDNPSVGSSICISRNGTRISGDMFAVGASANHRHLAAAVAVDSPGAGFFDYTLDFKTNPGGKAWASGTYLLAAYISSSSSSGPGGDQSTTSTTFTSTAEVLTNVKPGTDKVLLVATSQLWNDNPSVGSSICISRDGTRISGDMFAIGASATHRHLAAAVAVDSPGAGFFDYTLDFKTDSGGTAWASGTSLVAVLFSESWSSGPHGDQSTGSTNFTPTAETIPLEFLSGKTVLLIGTSQLWNSNPSIGSSICISYTGIGRISGDMFAVGASSSHRHLATAIVIIK